MIYNRTENQVAALEKLLTQKYTMAGNDWRLNFEIDHEDTIAVGFTRDNTCVLVMSWSRRTLYDLRSGAVVSTNDDSLVEDAGWWDRHTSSVLGIGDYVTEWIPIAARFCGGLSRVTRDGWKVLTAHLYWPVLDVLLMRPDALHLDEAIKLCPIVSDYIGVGFSSNDDNLIIAARDSIILLRRDGTQRI